MFVALAYFGTDQSQVQRYLTGESVTQSRLALLFNGFGESTDAILYPVHWSDGLCVFSIRSTSISLHPVEVGKVEVGSTRARLRQLEEKHNNLFQKKSEEIREYLQARHQHDDVRIAEKKKELQLLQQRYDAVRAEASNLLEENDRKSDTRDTNYIFLDLCVDLLAGGVSGIDLCMYFTASMSSSSGELSAAGNNLHH